MSDQWCPVCVRGGMFPCACSKEQLGSRIRELSEELEQLRESHPKCLCCGKLASCMGSYDEAWGYACDECCGHGNEDGQCFPLADVPTRFQAALKWVGDANERADAAEASSPPPPPIDDEFPEPDPEPFFARVAELLGYVNRADGRSGAEYASEDVVYRAVQDMRAAWLRSQEPR